MMHAPVVVPEPSEPRVDTARGDEAGLGALFAPSALRGISGLDPWLPGLEVTITRCDRASAPLQR